MRSNRKSKPHHSSGLDTFSRWARGGVRQDELNSGGAVRRRLAHASQPHSAQSIVEFMLVSIPLLALIMGTMEFSLAFFDNGTVDFVERDVARETANCDQDCDVLQNGTLYNDYYALQVVVSSTLDMGRVQYVWIQHVGEIHDQPSNTIVGSDTITDGAVSRGRVETSPYSDYPNQYQLYAPPNGPSGSNTGSNSVAPRGSDPAHLYLNDATASQVGMSSIITGGDNVNNNGWRAASCLPINKTSTNCRNNIPNATSTGNATGNGVHYWPGRYICEPTDRFFVQVAYRHYWVTPFLPSINASGNGLTLKGFANGTYVLLGAKVYQKVEPTLYAGAGNCGVVIPGP